MSEKEKAPQVEWGPKEFRKGIGEVGGGLLAILAALVALFFVRVDSPEQKLKDWATTAGLAIGIVAGALAAAVFLAAVIRYTVRPARRSGTEGEEEPDSEAEDAVGASDDGGEGAAEPDEEAAEEPSLLDGDTLVPFLVNVMADRRGCHLDEILAALAEAGEPRWTKPTLKDHLKAQGIQVDAQTNLGRPWGNKAGVKRKHLPAAPPPEGHNTGRGFTVVDTHNGAKITWHDR